MTRPGFSLIEIIIALAISSFVSIMLFTTISLLQKTSRRYNEIISMLQQQEVMYAQLQKDITGMAIPLFGYKPNTKDTKEAQEKKQQEYFNTFMMQCDVETDRLKRLTFVTTSALQTFDAQKTGLVRVQYTLEPDKQNSAFFTLYRQESSKLGLKESEFTKENAYILAWGIKTCTITFTVFKEEENGKRKVEQISSTAFANRVKEQAKKGEKIEEKIALPQMITLAGVMVDTNSLHEYPFTYTFAVPSAPIESPKKQLEAKPEVARPEVKK